MVALLISGKCPILSMFLITEAVTHADAAKTIASIENVTIIVASRSPEMAAGDTTVGSTPMQQAYGLLPHLKITGSFGCLTFATSCRAGFRDSPRFWKRGRNGLGIDSRSQALCFSIFSIDPGLIDFDAWISSPGYHQLRWVRVSLLNLHA